MTDDLGTMGRSNLGSIGLRFLLAGATNTILTFALYQILLFALSPQLSYVLSWICGLGLVVLFYPSRVFKGGRTDGWARFKLGLTYAAIFFLGVVTLYGLGTLGIAPQLSIVFVMAVTTTANFLLGRFVLKKDRPSDADP